jgi:hypothetical protein
MITAMVQRNFIRRTRTIFCSPFHSIIILISSTVFQKKSGAAVVRLSAITAFFLIAFVFSANSTELPKEKMNSSFFPEKRSVPGVIKKIGSQAESRLRTYFERAGVSYPPSRITMIGLKDEMELEIWAEKDGRWVHIATYEIYAASGNGGPKQMAGDLQVPEGIYRITELNPNSRFYLSMRLDYPNDYDRSMARYDGRSNLGGDIYIHGRAKSKGCLAVGDVTIEELFVLAAKTGTENTKVVIVPYDFRKKKTSKTDYDKGPAWLPELYENLGREMARYQRG